VAGQNENPSFCPFPPPVPPLSKNSSRPPSLPTEAAPSPFLPPLSLSPTDHSCVGDWAHFAKTPLFSSTLPPPTPFTAISCPKPASTWSPHFGFLPSSFIVIGRSAVKVWAFPRGTFPLDYRPPFQRLRAFPLPPDYLLLSPFVQESKIVGLDPTSRAHVLFLSFPLQL